LGDTAYPLSLITDKSENGLFGWPQGWNMPAMG